MKQREGNANDFLLGFYSGASNGTYYGDIGRAYYSPPRSPIQETPRYLSGRDSLRMKELSNGLRNSDRPVSSGSKSSQPLSLSQQIRSLKASRALEVAEAEKLARSQINNIGVIEASRRREANWKCFKFWALSTVFFLYTKVL